jgi:hypothetical protein
VILKSRWLLTVYRSFAESNWVGHAARCLLCRPFSAWPTQLGRSIRDGALTWAVPRRVRAFPGPRPALRAGFASLAFALSLILEVAVRGAGLLICLPPVVRSRERCRPAESALLPTPWPG